MRKPATTRPWSKSKQAQAECRPKQRRAAKKEQKSGYRIICFDKDEIENDYD